MRTPFWLRLVLVVLLVAFAGAVTATAMPRGPVAPFQVVSGMLMAAMNRPC
jgi:hypothetical protein